MKIIIPPDKKQQFGELVKEYDKLHQELQQEPTSERHAEILERIVFISKQFETGLMETTGFEK